MRWTVGILLAILLISPYVLHTSAEDDLKLALQDAIEAQQVGEEVTEDVKAKIIDVAPEGILTSGTGDVATTGNHHLVQQQQDWSGMQQCKGLSHVREGKWTTSPVHALVSV